VLCWLFYAQSWLCLRIVHSWIFLHIFRTFIYLKIAQYLSYLVFIYLKANFYLKLYKEIFW
jgi:hypothetical protein